MEERILEIIYDEQERLWNELMDCNKYVHDPAFIASARARWSGVYDLCQKIEKEVKSK